MDSQLHTKEHMESTISMTEHNNTPNPVHYKRIALYVIFDRDGVLDGFRKYYLEELRKVVDYITVVVNGTLTPESREELEELADDFFVRENKGLLAYGWIEGLKHIGWDKLYEYDELLMLNDSFFGPLFPLKDMFAEMEKSDADFYGAMKVYEVPSLPAIQGRALKHGRFRGSICYFYVIRKKLLHSNEFKIYWTSTPDVKEDLDTFFFSEYDFYDYVRDAGFKIDSYQSDDLKDYFFDVLTHNMERLIKDEKIPFARIRPFASEMKDQSLQINYGDDPRKTLDYIEKHTNYDTNLIWDYLLRTKNLTNIWSQMQLEYVISKNTVERTFTYSERIAVILHIYYEDLVERIARYCENFLPNTDFYITTTKKKTEQAIKKEFSKRKLHYTCKIRPNVGVAMSTLWVTYAKTITSGKYKYICYFHDKKSPYSIFACTGEEFANRCYQNLFGTQEIIKNIINLFEDNPRLGVLGAAQVYHAHYFGSVERCWGMNYHNTVNLANRLGLKVNIDINVPPVAPYGDMFWFRADALKHAIGYGLTYDDFNVPYAPDGTFMHAIERIYGLAAQDAGYYYGDVVNTDCARSDLVNYQYMIRESIDILLKNGHMPANFEEFKAVLRLYKGQPQPRNLAKRFLKKLIDTPSTHKFGMFLWRTYRKIFKKKKT